MLDQIVSVSLKHHDSSLFSINFEYKSKKCQKLFSQICLFLINFNHF